MAASSPKPSDEKQQKGKDEKKKAKPKEYNPHWKGYSYILIASLINLSASSNAAGDYEGTHGMAVSFGSVTFALSFLILLFDRTKWLDAAGDFHKAFDGKIEGALLLLLILWWICGVCYQTQVAGIAYLANNVYFSSWMSLGCCIYTLDQWSTEKDILSVKELTGISETLPSWYLLFLGSLVVAGTSINLWIVLYKSLTSEAAMGMALGLVSSAISFTWILAHYNFIELFNEGGWLELGSSFFCVVMWIIGVAVLTSHGSVGATLVGSGCANSDGVDDLQSQTNQCNITYFDKNNEFQQITCEDILDRVIPGSNMYASLWLCLGSSLHIAFAWKKQQARNLAKAQQNRKPSEPVPRESLELSVSKDMDEDDIEQKVVNVDEEEMDDFQDADVY